MPWYRINGMAVHMKGTKLPAPCRAIIEIDGKRAHCFAPSGYLCDWIADGGRACDLPVCDAHRTSVGRNKDYCPEHAATLPQRGLFTSLPGVQA